MRFKSITLRTEIPAVIIIIAILAMNGCKAPRDDSFGDIAPGDYVCGRFDPAVHPQFVDIKTLKITVTHEKTHLRREAAEALSSMIADLSKANPKLRVVIVSGTRNWQSQKEIWEAKFEGRTPVDGGRLNKTHPDPRDRALAILKKSSMPGTSRHHWGTDVDINALDNRYFDHGDGKTLYRWLKRNAHRYGFGQPYTAGRSQGYDEERWHWSYLPLAAHFHKRWNSLYGKNPAAIIAKDTFAGAETCIDLAPQYVNAINPDCSSNPQR